MIEATTSPHLNLLLSDMEGEIWKDLKGFEGSYLVSNLGRVKRLKTFRIITGPYGNPIKQALPERIVTQHVKYRFNRHLKQNICAGVGLTIQQEKQESVDIIDANDLTTLLVEKTIIDSLKTLPEQPLKFIINHKSGSLLVEHSSGNFNFQISNAENYPKMKVAQDEEQNILTIPADRLKLGLERSQKQMADDELRPVMNGIYVDITKEQIIFVASDGHRLSRYTDTSLKIASYSLAILSL